MIYFIMINLIKNLNIFNVIVGFSFLIHIFFNVSVYFISSILLINSINLINYNDNKNNMINLSSNLILISYFLYQHDIYNNLLIISFNLTFYLINLYIIISKFNIFKIIESNYIYPIIWEDSSIDKKILNITNDDEVMMITSGGDNVFDTLIDNPKKIYSIDINKHQNYLLRLKIASIKILDREDYIKVFGGTDYKPFFKNLIAIIEEIKCEETKEWILNNYNNIKYFNRSGSCGIFIKLFDYISTLILRKSFFEELNKEENQNIEFQISLYNILKKYKISNIIYYLYNYIGIYVGVPIRQLKLMNFNIDAVDNILKYILLKTDIFRKNHYYKFYTIGLDKNCCFNYMKENNYEKVRNRLDKIEIHTDYLQNFVKNCKNSNNINKAVLLDHQDWIEQKDLINEWYIYLNCLNKNCKYFWRSSCDKQYIGILNNMDFYLNRKINLEQPDEYTDFIGMYKGIFYGKLNKDTIIPKKKINKAKLDFYKKMYIFKNMMTYSLLYKKKNDSHEDFLNKFYKNQAIYYDDYRMEMLHGKEHIMYSIPYKKNNNILILAGGTGDVLDYISDLIEHFNKITLVDLSEPLLEIAKNRIEKHNWLDKVDIIKEDVSNFKSDIKYDIVIITYSLTMIPKWEKTLCNVKNLLNENGYLAISDFGISPDQNIFSKIFWKNIFKQDGVVLNEEHLNFVDINFKKIFREFKLGSFPLVPFLKCPYYFSLHQKIN